MNIQSIPDKINYIVNLQDQLDKEYPLKKELPRDEFIQYLQWACGLIDRTIASIFDYVESSNYIKSSDFKTFKIICRELTYKLNFFDNRLFELGCDRDFDSEDFEYKAFTIANLENNAIPLENPNIKQLDELKDYLKKISIDSHIKEKTEISDKHPKHNPNLWDKRNFELFKYFIENYFEKDKRQLTNIWFYLKENHKTNSVFNVTKKKYKELILQSYDIEIKNFDKANGKYEDTELPTLRQYQQNFDDYYLNHQNT